MTRCQLKRCGIARESGLAEKYVRIVQDMGSTLRGEGGEGGPAPMIGFEPLFVCNDDG